MKYIITESRLDKAMFNYLDWKLNGLEKRKGEYAKFIFVIPPNKKYGVLGWHESGELYVNYKIKENIQRLFGLESSDALDVIGRYVEDRYNLEVKNTIQSNLRQF